MIKRSAILLILTVLTAGAAFAGPRYIRVNQVGYLPADSKIAVMFTNDVLSGVTFSVVRTSDNAVVFGPASIGTDTGAYSNFSHNYKLDFSSFQPAGALTYKITLSDGVTSSPNFIISQCVYLGATENVLNFFRAQRCGFNPHTNANCHLAAGTTRRDGQTVGGPRPGTNLDFSGGWHDAGDFIKFMITVTNSAYFMLFSYQENPAKFLDTVLANGLAGTNSIPDILDEAKYGIDWIIKMHPAAGEFYHQVGSSADHNLPLGTLPQNDNAAYTMSPYRPSFYGLGANNTGKAAAVLALAYQVYNARGDTAYANTCLTHAQELYTLAKANMSIQQSQPLADNYYDESSYHDDLELAAVELYKATNTASYLTDAVTYSANAGASDGFLDWSNLNFVAHYRLYPLATAGQKTTLKSYMTSDLNYHRTLANSNVFGMGADYIWGSMSLMTGAILKTQLYKKLFPVETLYDSLGVMSRDYLLGKNQWGVCFIIGMGTTYPKDPQHNTAIGTNSDILGMPIEGPMTQTEWNGYGISLGAADEYAAFQSSAAVYHDDIEDYATNETTIMQGALSIGVFANLADIACGVSTPTITRTNTPVSNTATITATVTKTNTATHTKTSTATATQTATKTSTATATQTALPNTATVTKTNTSTATPTVVPNTFTVTPSATQTMTATTTKTFTPTATQTPPANTATITATITATNTATVTKSATTTVTQTPVPYTPTVTSTATETGTATVTKSSTATVTQTPVPFTPSVTGTNTQTFTPTGTDTVTATQTQSYTATVTQTHTDTYTVTQTCTITQTSTDTPVHSPTQTDTITQTPTQTPFYSATMTATQTATQTFEPTATVTATATQSATAVAATFTITQTVTPTDTPVNASATPTGSFTSTATVTQTLTVVISATPTNTVTLVPSTTPTCACLSTFTQTPTITQTFVVLTLTATPTVSQTSVVVLPSPTMTHTPVNYDDPRIINLYPNPAKDKFTIQYEVEQNGADVEFAVYTSAYRLVQRENMKKLGGIHNLVFGFDGAMANGVYFLVYKQKGEANDKKQIVKFIILK